MTPNFGQVVSVRDSEVGGADRDRTGDLMLAKHALSQLSYSPILDMVGLGRIELPTSPLSGVRSSHLSYRPSSVTGARLLNQIPHGKESRTRLNARTG
jgi:hypothetical protein